MIFETKIKTGLKDIGRNYKIKNESILEILENVGGEHSNSVGYGALDIDRTRKSWVLLDWKVKVLDRPLYSDELTVKTWGRYFKRAYTYRDYEIYNSKGELAVVATSKWAMVDIDTHGVARLTEEMGELYQPEDSKRVFEEETLGKIVVPEVESCGEYRYTIKRGDIDLNYHFHNTLYLGLAYEALPEDVYEMRPFNNIRVSYRHEIKLGDEVECKCYEVDGKYIVTITVLGNEKENAIVEIEK